MRKPATAFAGVLAISILAAGCANVPKWVVKGSGPFPGEQGKAIYAVGAAAPESDAKLQADLARLDARGKLVRIETQYAEKVLWDFVQKHKDWFDPQYVASVKLCQQAGEQVTEATRFEIREVTTWLDKGGNHKEKGKFYVLMMLPLDDIFFTAAQLQYDALIQSHKDKLLKKELDVVLKGLDKDLKNVRQDPLGVLAPPKGEAKRK